MFRWHQSPESVVEHNQGIVNEVIHNPGPQTSCRDAHRPENDPQKHGVEHLLRNHMNQPKCKTG